MLSATINLPLAHYIWSPKCSIKYSSWVMRKEDVRFEARTLITALQSFTTWTTATVFPDRVLPIALGNPLIGWYALRHLVWYTNTTEGSKMPCPFTPKKHIHAHANLVFQSGLPSMCYSISMLLNMIDQIVINICSMVHHFLNPQATQLRLLLL